MDDRALGLAGHLNHVQSFREGASWSARSAVREQDGILLIATGGAFPVVAHIAFRTDDAVKGSALLAAATNSFGERGRGFTLLVRDGPVAADLEAAAVAAGLTVTGAHFPEMARRDRMADQPLPDGVKLRLVEHVDEVEDTISAIADACPSIGFPAEEAKLMWIGRSGCYVRTSGSSPAISVQQLWPQP